MQERLAGCSRDHLVLFATETAQRFESSAALDGVLLEIRLATDEPSSAAPKNLIFGSVNQPDLRLKNSLTNEVEILDVHNEWLVYDREIAEHRGLRFIDLVVWWRDVHDDDAVSDNVAATNLYLRMEEHLNDPERVVMETYRVLLREDQGFGLPALVPQVQLHYDPVTVRSRIDRGQEPLPRQRMDFLMLFPRGRRIVIEVDGRHHYSVDGKAAPHLYAEMVTEDRRIRLEGYEVYRFGGQEFVDQTQGKMTMIRFFQDLLARYGVRSPR